MVFRKANLLMFLITLNFMVCEISASTVTGAVTLQGIGFFGSVKNKKDRSGVLVYISGFNSAAPTEILNLTQENKSFLPKVVPVVKGQKVKFPNYDEIYHNVFSVSSVLPFDLGQYQKGEEPEQLTFEQLGLVPVYCNIHPKMIAYIVVLENDAFAMTDKNGKFTIDNIPPGEYTINAWIYGAKRISQSLIISKDKTQEIELTLEQIQKTKPHKRKDSSPYPKEVVEYSGD